MDLEPSKDLIQRGAGHDLLIMAVMAFLKMKKPEEAKDI